MKHIKLLVLFVLSCGLYGNCVAEVTSATPQLAIDPTLVFFTSLSTCTPGDYDEQNDLAQQVGQPYLKQRIIGLEDGVCSVILSTPDNRTMTCAFPMPQLVNFTDQHFLQGMIQSASKPDRDGINAETLWSCLKTSYCIFESKPFPCR
jgi:hypothetical protein